MIELTYYPYSHVWSRNTLNESLEFDSNDNIWFKANIVLMEITILEYE